MARLAPKRKTSLDKWEEHVKGCATCAASKGHLFLCERGRKLFTKASRMLR